MAKDKNPHMTFQEDPAFRRRDSAWNDAGHYRMPLENTVKDYVDRTICKRRAAEFQAGHNPMEQTRFEQQLVNQEKQIRIDARQEYIRGIQGRDGGNRFQNYERTFEDGPEVN